MSIVLIKETEDSDPIRFELDNQGRISCKTIDKNFPSNRGLELKGSLGHMQRVNLNEAGLYYVAPADGWPETPIKVVIPSTSRPEEEAKKVGETKSLSEVLRKNYDYEKTGFKIEQRIMIWYATLFGHYPTYCSTLPLSAKNHKCFAKAHPSLEIREFLTWLGESGVFQNFLFFKLDQLWINRCSPFIFYDDNSGSKYCVTIISEKYAATTRHGGHEHLNLEQEIIIKHDDGRSHVVRVIIIEEYNENGRDYVIFETVKPEKFNPFPGVDVSPGPYGEYILLITSLFDLKLMAVKLNSFLLYSYSQEE